MKLARISSVLALVAGSLLAASPAAAFAGDPDPITGQIGIASEYTGKGLGKSNEDPAAFGSVRWQTNGVDSSYVEFQSDVSRALTDHISARFRVNYSPDGYGATEEAWWTEAQATFKLTSNDKLSVAYGLRRLDGGNDYDAWNVGVKHKFTPAISGDLRWYDTDSHELGSRYDGRLVASISYSF